MRTKNDWLDWLFSQAISAASHSLDRIRYLFEALQLGRIAPITIAVTGTNGKGSTVKLLEQIYLAAGLRVAAVTSPHLLEFNERLTLNDAQVTDVQILNAFARVEAHRDQSRSINAFDFFHLAWFCCIEDFKPDVAIIEIGIGGRLDATNLLAIDASVITSIGLDHSEFLGDSRDSVGYEKAHLARHGCPLVCGEPDVPASVVQVSDEIGADLICINNEFSYEYDVDSWIWRRGSRSMDALPIPRIMLQNAATALMLVDALQTKIAVDDAAIQCGLEQVYLPGRFEVTQERCEIVYDIAHNQQATQWLAEQLLARPIQGATYFVVGLKQMKDAAATFLPMIAIKGDWYVSGLSCNDSTEPYELGQHLEALGVRKWYTSQKLAQNLELLMTQVTSKDRVVIFGSFSAVQEAQMYFEGVK